jgi:MarR-like DNA-binding transcriptional regulator SgrR of sgrS sRNA
VGIGFLALEVRQNNDLMMANARRARSASSESAFRAVAENADFAAILVKDAQGQELSAVEKARFRAFRTGLLVNLQSTFRDLRSPELASILSRYRNYQSTYPALTEVWLNTKMNYERDFIELMETNVFGANE